MSFHLLYTRSKYNAQNISYQHLLNLKILKSVYNFLYCLPNSPPLHSSKLRPKEIKLFSENTCLQTPDLLLLLLYLGNLLEQRLYKQSFLLSERLVTVFSFIFKEQVEGHSDLTRVAVFFFLIQSFRYFICFLVNLVEFKLNFFKKLF